MEANENDLGIAFQSSKVIVCCVSMITKETIFLNYPEIFVSDSFLPHHSIGQS